MTMIVFTELLGSSAKKKMLSQEIFNKNGGGSTEVYEDQHGVYGFGIINMIRKRILKFCSTMNMAVGNKIYISYM